MLNPETVDLQKKYVDKATVVVFSAEWCKDCHSNIPVLAQINRDVGLEVLVFGHLMRDSKNHGNRWSVPPSPPEVKEFNVIKIPLILVLNTQGQVLGEIVENPPEGKTLEQALLNILEANF
jgi:thiol-disulfide isomerase/thioredoxin